MARKKRAPIDECKITSITNQNAIHAVRRCISTYTDEELGCFGHITKDSMIQKFLEFFHELQVRYPEQSLNCCMEGVRWAARMHADVEIDINDPHTDEFMNKVLSRWSREPSFVSTAKSIGGGGHARS